MTSLSMLKVQVKELQERLEGQNAAEIEENLKMMKMQKRELELEEGSAKAKMENTREIWRAWILRWKHWKNRSEKKKS